MEKHQCGFKKKIQIFSSKQTQNNSIKQNLPSHVIFVDFKQTYYSTEKEELYKIIKELKIRGKLIGIKR